MEWLHQKYIGLVAGRLRNYKRKSNVLFNFSCPFCNDSATDKRKARGYIYEKKGNAQFHCHNCGLTYGFDKFLETFDYQLYSEYLLEKIKDRKSPQQLDLEKFVAKMAKPVFIQDSPLKSLKKVSQLKANHPCKLLVEKRKIPTPFHAKLFYCPKFFAWTNEIIPGKFSDEALLYDEPRLIIPFINEKQQMHAFQGRSFDPATKSRYITVVVDDSQLKVYGLDTVDLLERAYVFEGPIDSMFVPNSIATAGGDLVSTIKSLNKLGLVIVYDNEPRSHETIHKLEKAIINGYIVCIWPPHVVEKDVNDMIIAGYSPEHVKYIIDNNSYKDLEAQLALKQWRKV